MIFWYTWQKDWSSASNGRRVVPTIRILSSGFRSFRILGSCFFRRLGSSWGEERGRMSLMGRKELRGEGSAALREGLPTRPLG